MCRSISGLVILFADVYEICPEVIQPCNMKNRDIHWRRYKIQETLYIGQWCLSPLQSRYLVISHNSPNCHQLPHHVFLSLMDSLKSLLFQRWFWFGEKPEVAGHQLWAVEGLTHLGDLMFHQKFCMRCDAWGGVFSWWSCQPPAAHRCGLLPVLHWLDYYGFIAGLEVK